jgi:hypothetical protein
MSYELEAIIGLAEPIRKSCQGIENAHVIPLAQGLAMIPLTGDLRAELEGCESGETSPAADSTAYLSDGVTAWIADASENSNGVTAWIADASENSTIVWIEATYFGGWGGQTIVVRQNGEIIKGPVSGPEVINQALKMLGVEAEKDLDEFDTLRLGRYRHTQKWLELRDSND